MPRPLAIPQDIKDTLLDDNFWSELKEIADAGEKIMPEIVSASRKRGDSGTLDQRIQERCEFARAGMKLMALTTGSHMAKGFAPLCNPPIPTGMMHCIRAIERIVRKEYTPGRKSADFSKLAYLLKRVRHLLRVYYNFIVARQADDDLVFCDWETIFDVGITLHQVGLCLLLDPPRLRAVMAGGGKELESFLLDEELDVGAFRVAAIQVEKIVEADPESEDADRVASSKLERAAEADLAAHTMAWFMGDLAVAFFLNEKDDSDADEKRWAAKATKRLVHWSTSPTLRDAIGDPLTDAMRPIYWTTTALVKFCQAGGLGALFGDWVNSSGQVLCGEILEKLPDAAWKNQTPTSLRHVTREIQFKLTHEGDGFASDPILIDALFKMYKHYGLAPFHKGAKAEKSRDPIVFHYIERQIKRDGLEMRTPADWRRLLDSYINMPRSVNRRYSWSNMTISGKWDCLEYYGCSNGEACPERKALEALREQRVRGVRDPAVEQRLEKWGAKPRQCAACGWTAYCSSECQKVHWADHKPDCLKKRKRA
ncbi:hypothetical protein FB45DRAFT_936963 [Roridomyces roridus]|uniref:MYND-type domain-containing protein n=1 Tax=Roridomyces roridus TaxID=1738132 RepID=A0AAD7B958_9AGAR|nr:hypothetical protein FB45DRAFT_936963 [Roridomyces roridus]